MSDTDSLTVAVEVGTIRQQVTDLGEKIDAIHRSMKEDISGVEERLTRKIDAVEVQTRSTNGRVRDHDLQMARIKGFGAAVVLFISTPAFLFVIEKLD